jgi:hypothetical protein
VYTSGEGAFDLTGSSGELNGGAGGRDFSDGETLGLEPCDNRLDIGFSGTELAADLRGRKPLVIVRATGCVLAGNLLLERSFLLRGTLEQQQDATGRSVDVDGTQVVRSSWHRTDVAVERDAPLVINGLHDLWQGDGGKGCGRGAEDSKAKH